MNLHYRHPASYTRSHHPQKTPSISFYFPIFQKTCSHVFLVSYISRLLKFPPSNFNFTHLFIHFVFFRSFINFYGASTEFRLSFPQALQLTEPSPVAEYAAPFMRTLAPKQKKMSWDFFDSKTWIKNMIKKM